MANKTPNLGLNRYTFRDPADIRRITEDNDRVDEAVSSKAPVSHLTETNPHPDSTYTKTETDETFYKKEEGQSDISSAVSEHTKSENPHPSTVYTKDEIHSRYYTRSVSDNRFLTTANGDSKISTAITNHNNRSNPHSNSIYDKGETDAKIESILEERSLVSVPGRLYVSQQSGSDENDGSQASPLKTLNEAVLRVKRAVSILSLNVKYVYIYLMDRKYVLNETLGLGDMKQSLFIQPVSGIAEITCNSNRFIGIVRSNNIEFRNLFVTMPGGSTAIRLYDSQLVLNNVSITKSSRAGEGIWASRSHVKLTGCTLSGCTDTIVADEGSIVACTALKGSNNRYALSARDGFIFSRDNGITADIMIGELFENTVKVG